MYGINIDINTLLGIIAIGIVILLYCNYDIYSNYVSYETQIRFNKWL